MSNTPAKPRPLLGAAELATLLLSFEAGRVALIGVDQSDLTEQLTQELPEWEVSLSPFDADWFDAIPDLDGYPLLYICAGDRPAPVLEQRLAAARDRFRGLLLVEEDQTSCVLSQSDYFALGFRLASGLPGMTSSVNLYCYSLHDYKVAPDWLNAKFWAHPERWNMSD